MSNLKLAALKLKWYATLFEVIFTEKIVIFYKVVQHFFNLISRKFREIEFSYVHTYTYTLFTDVFTEKLLLCNFS